MQQQIRDWLNERGMAHYADAFAAQNVDLAILPDLTDQDLKDLGVLLGDRRKLLAWAAGLKRASVAPENDGIAGSAQPQSNLGERRQVTVLFSDLVDSTALSRSIDPEDLRALIRSYQDAVTKTVRRLDGLVAGFRGDGVLVYFGYPNAHEDDAERAVRAGLELVEAVRALPCTAALKIRVGIATGLVVVGDLIRAGDTQERDILGETPNLAARILALAEPDTVVIADATRRLLGDLYEFTDLGLRRVKGIEEPVRTWSVLQPHAVESRYDALHSAGVTELTGRDDELSLLKKRWSKAKGGDGQVVLISGEPGIGKSRLTAALMEEIAGEPHARLRYFCSPQHTDSAFYPVIGHLERAAGFAHGDGPEAKLDKLEKLLNANAVNPEGKALIAALLSLPTDRYPALDYDAAQRRAKTMEALHAQVVTLCSRGPVLMILEDAHWIDPTSLEAFGRMVEKLKDLPILLVITYRPEFNAPWVGDSHVTTINLNRLDDAEAARIVASLAGNKPLSADTIADIVDRSDGIPLFLEEMTKAVLEAESEGAARETVAAAPSQSHAVPASLHASLMSRLDRLGPAKGIAHVGAAIGRSFSHALLAAVANDDPDTLRIHLDRLIASGLLFRQGQPPDATYLFKHALIRDAAYSMLLREPRRALHARILEALETRFPDIAETQPELLANHATEAAQIEKAAYLWGKSGDRSVTQSALAEGIAQLNRAQSMLAALPTSAKVRQEQLALQVPLATAISQVAGYSAPETKAAYESLADFIHQMEAHGDSISDPWPPFASFWGLYLVYLVAADQSKERMFAARCYDIAHKHGDSFQKMISHNLFAHSHYFAGNFKEAKEEFDRTIELYEVGHFRPRETTQDQRVVAKVIRAYALNILGYPSTAKTEIYAALEEAREIGHASTLLHAQVWTAWFRISFEEDYAIAAILVDEIIALADKFNTAYWKAWGLIQKGAYLALVGGGKDAIELLTDGLDSLDAMGGMLGRPHQLSFLALAHANCRDFEEAWRQIDKALTISRTTGQMYAEAITIYDFAARIALAMPEPDTARAESYLHQGLSFVRERDAKGMELRLSLALARLWRDQGKAREAYDLLAPVYHWFTEGFEWTDMKQTKALLDELKAQIG